MSLGDIAEVLPELVELTVIGCNMLPRIDSGRLLRLKNLTVTRCHRIVDFINVAGCVSLENIAIVSCDSLTAVTGMGGLKKLRRVAIAGCLLLREADILRDLELESCSIDIVE